MKTSINWRRWMAILVVVGGCFAVVGDPARAQPLLPGDIAPDFRLPATTGGMVSLSDFRGSPVLIEFYHSDWGPTCIANLAERRNDHHLFAELGVVVVAISIDHAYSQAAFAQSLNLPYPLLSDYPHGHTIDAYGVGYREGNAERLFARPSFFLIDQEGIIRHYWGQRPIGIDEVLPPDPLVMSEPMLQAARALFQEP